MSGTKQHISDLVHHCAAYGMRHLVISPGSRNAPLTRAFAESTEINCSSVVDERSAAFVALGMARQLHAPVGVLCTSGTALLNYGPAIAEAYYLRVPLVVISADRPARLIGQQDSQTIRQNGLFDNIVKGSYTLPEEPATAGERAVSAATVAEAFSATMFPDCGPVHINVPVDEPLYEDRLSAAPSLAAMSFREKQVTVDERVVDSFAGDWLQAEKKMIVCGQAMPDETLSLLLETFAADETVVVVAENLANLQLTSAVDRPDSLLLSKTEAEREAMAPDVVVSFGGHLVSKHIKILLRQFPAGRHVRLDVEKRGIDTYETLTDELAVTPVDFFSVLLEKIEIQRSSGFRQLWQLDESATQSTDGEYLVLRDLVQRLPKNSIAHLGNSMSVRHVQKLPTRADLVYHSNRGVAGIDGCLSTAVGVAMVTHQLVLCCLGDLSFVYDSNGLWNNELPANLRVVILNNGGGDIFRRLKGPNESPGYEKFFVAHHPVNLGKLVEAYGATYMKSDVAAFPDTIGDFLADHGAAVVMEVEIN